MEIYDKKGTQNVVDDQLSRMNDVKIEELPFNDYFHDDRVIAFLRVEEPRYAHLI